MYLLTVILLATLVFTTCSTKSKSPHIIFLLADDLGWNDVSFHGSPQIPTPNIDALAASGVVLQNCYAAPQCSPSRGSLLSGKYPIRLGLQHFVIKGAEATALPIDVEIMPQYLKRLGYSTHMVGKWHLGYYRTEYFPTRRGFDTFFGYLNGRLDYYDYTFSEKSQTSSLEEMWGIDLYNGTTLIKDFRGRYSTDVYTEKALDIIARHDEAKPLFLYWSPTATHAGNPHAPLQALPEEVAKYSYIKSIGRGDFAGTLSRLDESIGKIFQSLAAKGMLENSIIVFSSDNGGEANGVADGFASNWPLRSMKMHLFEGGVRIPALMWSPLLKLKEPRVSKQLMYISDWLPTLYRAAGGDINDLGYIDGINLWDSIIENTQSPRFEMLLNIDPIIGMSALRWGDLKLVNGTYTERNDFWYGPSGRENMEFVRSLDQWVWKNGSVVKEILEQSGFWLVKTPDQWRSGLSVECGDWDPNKCGSCDPKIAPCLFNIAQDPCEYNNLAIYYPEMVRAMMERIAEINLTAMAPQSKPNDPHGNPKCHGFAFVPWLDEENQSACQFI